MGKTILTPTQRNFLEVIQQENSIVQITLASQFLRVGEFKDYPKMLIPFDTDKMEEFFLEETRKLKEKILE